MESSSVAVVARTEFVDVIRIRSPATSPTSRKSSSTIAGSDDFFAKHCVKGIYVADVST